VGNILLGEGLYNPHGAPIYDFNLEKHDKEEPSSNHDLLTLLKNGYRFEEKQQEIYP
jgi:hypothetical protein